MDSGSFPGVPIDRGGRQTWRGKLDFLIALVACSAGFDHLWRFPYFVYRNGGVAFLIPYLIMMFTVGVPLLFLEVSHGQFTASSGALAWELYPLLKGIGVATTWVALVQNLYFVIITAWTFFYLYSTITTGDLPWKILKPNYGELWSEKYPVPEMYYWEKQVLGLSDEMGQMGSIQLHLAACLAVTWIAVYICIIKGVKWTGKIVWITGVLAYLVLLILFLVGATLNGSRAGLQNFLMPDFSKLFEVKVWLDAGTCVMFSLQLGLGTMPVLGSFNEFDHNCLRDCLILALVKSATSVVGGLCVSVFLGYLAEQLFTDYSSVVTAGTDVAFVVFPQAFSFMAPTTSKLLSVLFFLMLILLGLNYQFMTVVGFITQFMDTFPRLFNFRHSRAVFTTIACLCCYFFGELSLEPFFKRKCEDH